MCFYYVPIIRMVHHCTSSASAKIHSDSAQGGVKVHPYSVGSRKRTSICGNIDYFNKSSIVRVMADGLICEKC